jgi:FMN phosphatase YigB (HAD superfamily)
MNPPARQAPTPFKLNITRGVRREPPRIVIHGAPGIGKSTLASRAPSPLFIDLEHGTKQIDVARVDDIDTWEALLAALHALAADPGDFRTVVIDTLDRAEWLCWQHLCTKERVDSIEKIGRGFGKGFTAAYEQFRAFAAALEALRRKGIAVIIIAHSKIEKAPEDDRERWTLKVHKQVAGLFYEMFDAILFARLEVFTQKAESGKLRGIGDARVLETQEDPKWLAKNRYAMPRQIPLSWEDLNDAMNRGAEEVTAALRAEIDAALAKLADLDADAARAARAQVDSVTDEARLGSLLGRINAGISARINTKND